jgi:hypothetical protein
MTARLITPADAARHYQRPIASVYRLANHHQWRRLTLNGRTYYDLQAVDAVLSRKHSTARMRKLRAQLD